MPRVVTDRASSRDRGRDDDRAAPRGRGRDDRDDDRDDDREERGSRGGRGTGGGGSKFQYRGRTSEENQRRAKQSSGRYDSFIEGEVIWFKPREGENTIRIIPWASSDKSFDDLVEKYGTHWGIDLMVHNQVGADKGSYLCTDKMRGEPCPICDAYRDEGIEALRLSERVLVWLIDRDDEKAGPKLWSMPLSNSRDISGASSVKGSGELLAVDDPEEGYDVYFVREGTKRNTRYKQFDVARDPSPLSTKAKTMEKWLDYVVENPLPGMLKFYDAEYLDKVLSGQASSREEAEDEGEERGGGRRGRGGDKDDRDERSSRRGRSDDSETDDPPPRSSRRGRDPEADPEDEPAPRSRRGGRDDPDDGEFTRPSRRASRDDREPEDAPDDELEDKPARRGERAGRDPDPEDDPPPRSERYRGKDKEPEGDDSPKERLSRVGRRGR